MPRVRPIIDYENDVIDIVYYICGSKGSSKCALNSLLFPIDFFSITKPTTRVVAFARKYSALCSNLFPKKPFLIFTMLFISSYEMPRIKCVEMKLTPMCANNRKTLRIILSSIFFGSSSSRVRRQFNCNYTKWLATSRFVAVITRLAFISFRE